MDNDLAKINMVSKGTDAERDVNKGGKLTTMLFSREWKSGRLCLGHITSEKG